MALFKKGFEAVKAEKQRQDEIREKAGKKLFKFYLPEDGSEADIRFLTHEPINFEEHSVKSVRNGKEYYDSVLCTGDRSCPHCKEGSKPTFKGAFLIWDFTEFDVTDKDTNKKKRVSGSVKLYVAGTKVLSQLDRISTRYANKETGESGLADRTFTIIRTGKGTATSYMVEKGDKLSTLSAKDIEKLLPEKLKELYTGTSESLDLIVEEQLKMYLPNSTDDEEEDDLDEEYEDNKNLVTYADEDEEEDEKPVLKKSGTSSIKKLIRNRK